MTNSSSPPEATNAALQAALNALTLRVAALERLVLPQTGVGPDPTGGAEPVD
jgi:hypothetical protein